MITRRFFALLGFLLMVGLAPLAIAQETEQQQPNIPPLPIDEAVRMGQLDNGLTYIIRHNAQPDNRADFYIAQRVGSMQEEDNQAGLAHFLEHMAFNGTRNFPDKKLISYLQSIGVRFGSHLNAYTAFDETMYTIMNAPIDREGVVDSCLLILRDWSDGIALEEEEIDAERLVIEEEWRQRDSGMMRMYTELIRRAFPEGSRYGNRMPIGSMDVVRNFTYQELRDYYHKWYRPDLQGIIVVGDIDVDEVEKKIKELFGDLPKPVNAAERVYEQVPDREEPLSIVVTDPEGQGTVISISYAHDAPSRVIKASALGITFDYFHIVLRHMMNARFREILEAPNPPFIGASMGYGSYMGVAATEDALEFSTQAFEGRGEDALNALVAEIKRARDFGFTEAEYERAKTDLLTSYDNMLKEKDNRTNSQYAEEYGSFFTEGGYILGIEIEHALMNQFAPSISLEAVNQYFQGLLSSDNLTIYMMSQRKEGVEYPTEEQLLAQYYKAFEHEVEPYAEEVSNVPLMEVLPEPGTILSEERDLAYGATKWVLSNGIKVYVLPTEHKKNDIRITGMSPGGYLLYKDKETTQNINALANSLGTVGGVAQFSPADLRKVLTGKAISVSTDISEIRESVSGTSSEKDIEAMFQLLHLSVTDIREDKSAFDARIEREKASRKASYAHPLSTILTDSLPALIYPNNPLQAPLSVDDYDHIDYHRVLELHRERFADMGDFTFFIVGSVDLETLQPLVERYLASLPNLRRNDPDLSNEVAGIAPQSNLMRFNQPMDTPTSVVIDVFATDGIQRNNENILRMTYLTEILNQHYFKSIREDEGGTYGVNVIGQIDREPVGQSSFMIFFQSNVENGDYLNQKAKTELQQMAEQGLEVEYFDKTTQNLLNKHEEDIKENSYWMNQMLNNFYFGEDRHSNYLDTLKSTTIEDVNAFLKLFMQNHRLLELNAIGVERE